MRLSAWGQRLSTGLGVASWGRWLAAMGVVAAACSVAAFGMGVRWERGAQALSEVNEQRTQLQAKQAEIADLRQAAKDIKQAGLDAAADYREAAQRQGSIADDWHRFLGENRRWYAQQDQQLDALFARLPADVARCTGGDSVRDHWNRASQGPRADDAAAPAAAGDRPGPAAPVRSDAGGTERGLRNAGAGARR